MQSNILKSVLLAGLLGTSFIASAATDTSKTTVSEDVSSAAHKAGTKINNAAGVTKDVAVDTGEAVKDGAVAAGHKAKNAAETVGHETKKGAAAVGHKTKEVTVDTKKKVEKAVKNNTATEGEAHGSPSN
ncbi:hypothetical protein VVD49_14065 [Uliginosibacterium sp. H3]|uniref:Uncharacterized protein n=1 Tax=Uliginosibacterium silvisoli TaxID=3114758 RepID=A0ABU6K6I5_9RHOO|nr:hypothetical protein [Uliginosibacterium sp. H3]